MGSAVKDSARNGAITRSANCRAASRYSRRVLPSGAFRTDQVTPSAAKRCSSSITIAGSYLSVPVIAAEARTAGEQTSIGWVGRFRRGTPKDREAVLQLVEVLERRRTHPQAESGPFGNGDRHLHVPRTRSIASACCCPRSQIGSDRWGGAGRIVVARERRSGGRCTRPHHGPDQPRHIDRFVGHFVALVDVDADRGTFTSSQVARPTPRITDTRTSVEAQTDSRAQKRIAVCRNQDVCVQVHASRGRRRERQDNEGVERVMSAGRQPLRVTDRVVGHAAGVVSQRFAARSRPP